MLTVDSEGSVPSTDSWLDREAEALAERIAQRAIDSLSTDDLEALLARRFA